MSALVLNPQTPSVDPSNGTTISLGTDGKLQISVGGAAPIDVGTAADPGRRVSAAVDGPSLDMTSLNGLTAGGYYVEGLWVAGTSGDHDLILQLNGVVTGYTTQITFGSGAGLGTSATGDFGGGANTTGIALCRAGGNSTRNRVLFRFTVSPANGSDLVLVSGEAISFASASGNVGQPANVTFTAVFLPSAPITEIKVLRNDANATGILAGSWMRAQGTGLIA